MLDYALILGLIAMVVIGLLQLVGKQEKAALCLASRGLGWTPTCGGLYVLTDGPGVVPINLTNNTLGTPISVPGCGWGIAVTPDGKTAYVANLSGNSVTPITLTPGGGTAGTAITGGGLYAPDGIAITPDGKTAYVTNWSGASVTPITLSPGGGTAGTAITGVGTNPIGIAIT
jgi:DNA-binding beta-propeller fold protein YncE